jgi:hypothetical protein
VYVLPGPQEVLVDQANDIEPVGNDGGTGKVLLGDVALGLGQVHDDQFDVVFAPLTPQIAVHASLGAPQAYIEDPVAPQVHQGGGKSPLAREEVLIKSEDLGQVRFDISETRRRQWL